MSAALHPGRVAEAEAGARPSPPLRRLLVRLVLTMHVPLALVIAGLLASYWDNQMDHAVDALRVACASLDAGLDERIAYGPDEDLGSGELERLFTRVSLPPGWTAGFVDRGGRIVAHSADQRLVGTAVPVALLGKPEPALGPLEWTGPDGRTMLTSSITSPVHGWTSFVSVPRTVLLAPVWETAGKLFLGLAAMVALGLWGALRSSRGIAHSLDALQEAAHALPARREVVLPRLTFSEAEELGATLEASARAVLQANAALEQSEQRLAAVLRTAGNAIIVTDCAHRTLIFNEAAERIFGRSKAEMVGQSLEILFTRKSWQHFSSRCAAAAPEAIGGVTPAGPARSVCLRGSGTTFPVELLVSRFVDPAGERFCTLILRDITEPLRSEQSLLAAHRAVQRMNDGFQRTLLKEMDSRMAAIARELHDAVGSTLAGISLLAASGRATAAEPRLVMLLEKVQDQVHAAAERVRQISRGIMPAGSDAGALLPALEQFAQGIGAAQDIACWVRARGCFGAVVPEAGGHVYRVVQEATANALRHGHATRIRIVLAQAGGRCRVTVADNGSGCDLGQVAASHGGMGMKSMRARADAIDGRLDARSRPGAGFRVSLEWRMEPAPT